MAKSRSLAWERREVLREKGQFWTPDWVADAMVAYVSGTTSRICDPAFGAGSFALAGSRRAGLSGADVEFFGFELDGKSLEEAKRAGVRDADLARVELRDFLSVSGVPSDTGFVANPPYVRHHRMSPELKAKLRQQTGKIVGRPLDGRAGLHVHFLVHALSLLGHGGALAFIVPADTCEGVFAQPLWEWIVKHYRLEAVLTFYPSATPFPGVDTNPVVVFIRRLPPEPSYVWAQISTTDGPALSEWVQCGFPPRSAGSVRAEARPVTDGVASGVAREPRPIAAGLQLGHLARVMRGVATGANEFFWLTSRQVRELAIPPEFLVRAVGRTRDVPGDRLTAQNLDSLDEAGRPTYLLVLDGRPLSAFPEPLRAYLQTGQDARLPERSLIAQRKPWYRMERRTPPAFLFAYLGRRNARFVRNEAKAIPLTGFLCVYPDKTSEESLLRLEALLKDREVLQGLPAVAKTYGGGALKAEPRSLERLPIPYSALRRAGFSGDFTDETMAVSPRGQLAMAL